jgi:DNA polymerase-3 subunit epsilon
MKFLALDVETANPNLASICQIGIVTFSNNAISAKWHTLVNPQDYFDPMNVSIHGIKENMVRESPTFQQIYSNLRNLVENKVVITYTPFDKTAITRVSEKYGLSPLNCIWLDAARVVRRSWEDFQRSGYGLSNVAKKLHIDFEHHNAVEDARVAGEILLRAVEHTGIGIDEWLSRAYQPITTTATAKSNIARAGNPNGLLFGEVAVFTGSLSIPRRQAAELATNAGCDVASNVTKKTTLLIVGNQDINKLVGHNKSSKHRKAEGLISKGQNIRIMGESDFLSLIETS